jgi:hypothetical protein
MSSARATVEALLTARAEGSHEGVRERLAPDAAYWDCVRGDLHGAAAVAGALAERAPLAVRVLAAAGDHAVVELDGAVTEVYGLEAGAVAWCRTYLDPGEPPPGPRPAR